MKVKAGKRELKCRELILPREEKKKGTSRNSNRIKFSLKTRRTLDRTVGKEERNRYKKEMKNC